MSRRVAIGSRPAEILVTVAARSSNDNGYRGELPPLPSCDDVVRRSADVARDAMAMHDAGKSRTRSGPIEHQHEPKYRIMTPAPYPPGAPGQK